MDSKRNACCNTNFHASYLVEPYKKRRPYWFAKGRSVIVYGDACSIALLITDKFLLS